ACRRHVAPGGGRRRTRGAAALPAAPGELARRREAPRHRTCRRILGGAICLPSRLDPPCFVGLRFTGMLRHPLYLAHELGPATQIALTLGAQPPLVAGLNVLFEVPSTHGPAHGRR